MAFTIVGNALALSTFPHLYDLVSWRAEVKIEVIPGITAIQIIAATSYTPLVESQETLSLVPWTVGPETLTRVCEVFNTIAIHKGGREMIELHAALDAQGRLGEAALDADLGLLSEHLVPLPEATDRAPYFNTVLAASKRSTTGGRIWAD